ncbi:response regulator transcription factor, partial [Pseudomonas syringae group genomosp. 7]|uniref:response regulator transcription factor n=1 Tax=Pseudomonas syringae group genomosp. 7 TaxID=251699 RepID=UPI00376FA0D6
LRIAPFVVIDLIRKVRESDRSELQIIIVSCEENFRDAIDAMHLNVVDFLLKPLYTKQLVILVKRELGIG